MPKPDDRQKLYRDVRVGVLVPKPVADWIKDEADKLQEHPLITLRRMILNLYKEANPVSPDVGLSIETEDRHGKKVVTDLHIAHPGIE